LRRTASVSPRPTSVLARRGEYHHRQELRFFIGADALQDFKPVHPGHLQIQQDHLRQDSGVPSRVLPGPKKVIHCLDPVLRHDHLVQDIAFFERPERQFHVIGVVFDQQYYLIFHGHSLKEIIYRGGAEVQR
jgi:hypothetical protein